MKRLGTYEYKGQKFAIVSEDGITRAINYKYIDGEGRLTKQLNGLEMYVDMNDQSVEGIKKRIADEIDLQEVLTNMGLIPEAEMAAAIWDFYQSRK